MNNVAAFDSNGASDARMFRFHGSLRRERCRSYCLAPSAAHAGLPETVGPVSKSGSNLFKHTGTSGIGR